MAVTETLEIPIAPLYCPRNLSLLLSLLSLDDCDFDLPDAQIARHPSLDRDHCRLLALSRKTGALSHFSFCDLPRLLPEGAVLVLNDTRVLPARLFLRKESGGRCEMLYLSSLSETRWVALLKGSSLRIGMTLESTGGESVRIEDRREGGWILSAERPIQDILAKEGEMPIPPYIAKARVASGEARIAPADVEAYNTVFAREKGSVAAPTAGLHFTRDLLSALEQSGVTLLYVTLHVGWGTFAPLRSEAFVRGALHEEVFFIAPEMARVLSEMKRAGRPLVAVGTTAVRALESAWNPELQAFRAGRGATDLFVRPGYSFRAVDHLVTNFHLPRSSLLLLVSAFAGKEGVRCAYREAIEKGYRFYSYGDAMFIRG